MLEVLYSNGGIGAYDNFAYLLTRFDTAISTQQDLSEWLRQLLGDSVIKTPFVKSSAVSEAGLSQKTIFEVDLATTKNRKTYERALESVMSFSNDIEKMIQSAWGRAQMKRDLLAKSLAQMGSKPLVAAEAGSKVDESSPRSLKSMSDVLSQVSAQAAQDVDVNEIGDSEIADRFDVSEGLDDLIESIRTSGQQLPALLRYRRGPGPRYEVVYGRRRIAACRVLGIKVKAYVRRWTTVRRLSHRPWKTLRA